MLLTANGVDHGGRGGGRLLFGSRAVHFSIQLIEGIGLEAFRW